MLGTIVISISITRSLPKLSLTVIFRTAATLPVGLELKSRASKLVGLLLDQTILKYLEGLPGLSEVSKEHFSLTISKPYL